MITEWDDISAIRCEQETIFTGIGSYYTIPHATWEEEDKPFALISGELATDQFKPGYIYQLCELTLEIVGYEPPIDAWFVKRHEEPSNER